MVRLYQDAAARVEQAEDVLRAHQAGEPLELLQDVWLRRVFVQQGHRLVEAEPPAKHLGQRQDVVAATSLPEDGVIRVDPHADEERVAAAPRLVDRLHRQPGPPGVGVGAELLGELAQLSLGLLRLAGPHPADAAVEHGVRIFAEPGIFQEALCLLRLFEREERLGLAPQGVDRFLGPVVLDLDQDLLVQGPSQRNDRGLVEQGIDIVEEEPGERGQLRPRQRGGGEQELPAPVGREREVLWVLVVVRLGADRVGDALADRRRAERVVAGPDVAERLQEVVGEHRVAVAPLVGRVPLLGAGGEAAPGRAREEIVELPRRRGATAGLGEARAARVEHVEDVLGPEVPLPAQHLLQVDVRLPPVLDAVRRHEMGIGVFELPPWQAAGLSVTREVDEQPVVGAGPRGERRLEEAFDHLAGGLPLQAAEVVRDLPLLDPSAHRGRTGVLHVVEHQEDVGLPEAEALDQRLRHVRRVGDRVPEGTVRVAVDPDHHRPALVVARLQQRLPDGIVAAHVPAPRRLRRVGPLVVALRVALRHGPPRRCNRCARGAPRTRSVPLGEVAQTLRRGADDSPKGPLPLPSHRLPEDALIRPASQP
jgi:hypothetical protein